MKKAMTVILIAALLLTAFAATACRKAEKDAERDTGITSLQTDSPDTETDGVGQTQDTQDDGSAAAEDGPDTGVPGEGSDDAGLPAEPQDDGSAAAEDGTEAGTPDAGEDGGEEQEDVFGMFAGSYYFGSGVGWWSSSLILNADGTFTGGFHDWDSAPNDDDLDEIVYTSSFSGSFRNPKKINDYTYSFELDHIDYKNEPGTEEIVTSVDASGKETRTKLKYSEAYGLDRGTTTVYAYTAGAPLAELPESFKEWVLRIVPVKEEGKLPCKGLYAVEPGYGWSGPTN